MKSGSSEDSSEGGTTGQAAARQPLTSCNDTTIRNQSTTRVISGCRALNQAKVAGGGARIRDRRGLCRSQGKLARHCAVDAP
ncbi:hypothetical protein PoB_005892900 [Plakobranchus ocellatus]|uniref:Uncharacterized protein n=1 Tax=Plakobranchus ocellatus TaxID=259542 RepID=A0AAV4CM53_9GAST|nr:hypothetical protein PoB_005892900 [Plakobranchus ocellatus]